MLLIRNIHFQKFFNLWKTNLLKFKKTVCHIDGMWLRVIHTIDLIYLEYIYKTIYNNTL